MVISYICMRPMWRECLQTAFPCPEDRPPMKFGGKARLYLAPHKLSNPMRVVSENATALLEFDDPSNEMYRPLITIRRAYPCRELMLVMLMAEPSAHRLYLSLPDLLRQWPMPDGRLKLQHATMKSLPNSSESIHSIKTMWKTRKTTAII